jgi:hypothetical protein
MTNLFTNSDSFVLPSMNRVRLVDLPGISVPLAWQNKIGFQLLGSPALIKQIRRKTAVLHLDPRAPDLIRRLNTCFDSPDNDVRETAEGIAKEYGRKLAYHQLVLKRGDAINRMVRPDWQSIHWAHWAQIEKVWLGGGLMAGYLGEIAAAEAQTFIHQHGFPNYSLQVSKFGVNLPLVGAARTAPANARTMLMFDFGQTSIKKGIAHYQAGQLIKLEPLVSLPAKCPSIGFSRDRSLAEQTRNRILRVVTKAWQKARTRGYRLSHTMAVILACYLLNGQPRHEDWGCYGRLQLFSSHLQAYLSEQISASIGENIQVQLLHDGQAASLPYAGMPHQAVITFGTAMGIGFPPVSDTNLRSVSA